MLYLQATVTSDGSERQVCLRPGAWRYGRDLLRDPSIREVSSKIFSIPHTNKKGMATIKLCHPKYELEAVINGVSTRVRSVVKANPETGKRRLDPEKFVIRKGDSIRLTKIFAVTGAWHDAPPSMSFTLRFEALVEKDDDESYEDAAADDSCDDLIDDSKECATDKDRMIISGMVRHMARGAPTPAVLDDTGVKAERGYDPVLQVVATATAKDAALLGGNRNIKPAIMELSDGLKEQAAENEQAPALQVMQEQQRQTEERRRALAKIFGK